MKKVFTCVFLSFFVLSAVAQENKTTPDSRLADLDVLLNKVLKDQKVAGFAVAVIEGDKVIYSKGFGYRDVEHKKPVTPNTLFAIGSSSKAFTSALLGLLEKEGKLSLDGKATTYLPQLRFFNDNMNNQITLRDMMCHRTGLSRYDYSWYLFNTPNRDSIIQRVRYMEPNAGLREKWQYNNYMFLAQGMIAEKITGKSWEQNIKEKFFIPLGMTRSNTSIYEMQKDADASLPYTVEKDSIIKKVDYYDISGMGPAGSINSSVNEMANWLQVWMSGGYYHKKEILPSSYVGQAASAQMVMDGALPGEFKDIYSASYGFGWMISSYRGHYLVEHGGNIDGFSANAAFFPVDKLGIVVLTNQNGSAVPSLVRNSIADRIFKLVNIDWNGRQNEKKAEALKNKKTEQSKDLAQVLNTKPSHPAKDYVGFYHNPIAGTIDVSQKGDSLFAVLGKNRIFLKHYHYDVFELRDIDKKGVIDTAINTFRISFNSGIDGKMESMSVPLEGKNVAFAFRPKEVALTKEMLARYTGDYELAKSAVKVYLKDKTLFVSITGQPEYETISLGKDAFQLKNLKGFSMKFDLTGNKAESLTFIQPNGNFKATRKK